MISKLTLGLIKQGLINIYKNWFETVQWPVYVLGDKSSLGEGESSDSEHLETASAIKTLHQLDDIPWPDTQCIIVSPCTVSWADSLLGQEEYVNFYIYNEKESQRLFKHVRKDAWKKNFRTWDNIDRGYFFDIQYIRKDGRCHVSPLDLIYGPNPLSRERIVQNVHIFSHKVATRVTCAAKGWMPKEVREGRNVELSPPDWISDEQREEYDAEFLKMHDYIRSFYLACVPDNVDKIWLSSAGGENEAYGFCPATDALAMFVPMVFPCGYKVKAAMPEGIGPPRIRKATRGKQMFCFIGYERLYRAAKDSGADVEYHVEPHFRRGHIRHLWKEAGIDRFTLPQDHMSRHLLALQRGVRRVRVHPAWIGPKQFKTLGLDVEICQGEELDN